MSSGPLFLDPCGGIPRRVSVPIFPRLSGGALRKSASPSFCFGVCTDFGSEVLGEWAPSAAEHSEAQVLASAQARRAGQGHRMSTAIRAARARLASIEECRSEHQSLLESLTERRWMEEKAIKAPMGRAQHSARGSALRHPFRVHMGAISLVIRCYDT